MELIAHRGASAYATENSLQAVNIALGMGADAIEVDVHMSKDGEIIVHHNDAAAGINGERILLRDYEYSAIKSSVRLSNGECIPLLSEILQLVNKRAGLYVEIKQSGMADNLLKLLQKKYGFENIAVTSSLMEEIRYIKSQCVHIPVSYIAADLSGVQLGAAYAVLKDIQINEISLDWNCLKKSLMDFRKNEGFLTRVYTVNDKGDMESLKKFGIDAVFTDDLGIINAGVHPAGE